METTEHIFVNDHLVRASAGKRFVNYLVDIFFFYVVIIILSVIMTLTIPSFAERVQGGDKEFELLLQLVSLLFYILFMGLMEYFLDGKTMGKLLTGTRAVRLDGEKISIGQAFGRAAVRLVPFCAFSAFGHPCDPWQDRWTGTMVIDIRASGH